jgi:RNA polymerase sigma factor (sigma-70 family)
MASGPLVTIAGFASTPEKISQDFRKCWKRITRSKHYELGRTQEMNLMAGGLAGVGVRNRLDILFKFGVVSDLSDGQLVKQFLNDREGSDQIAFRALVERHGPAVLSVCRQVLGKSHDAEDAFQAVFLILARRARSLRKPESVACWLHGVALRVALRVKADATRCRAHEWRSGMMKVVAADCEERSSESYPELHEEIARLPERYRQPVVLCYLEGLTTDQAASQIGVPAGTIHSRLSRARERLRGRLGRRGLLVPTPLFAAGRYAQASVALPMTLLDRTVRASLEFAGRRSGEAAVASRAITTLAKGVLTTMGVSRLTLLGSAVLVTALAVGGAQGFGYLGRPVENEQAAAAPAASDQDSSLTTSVNKLEAELNDSARRNAEMQSELRAIKKGLEVLQMRTSARPVDRRAPVQQLAAALGGPGNPAVSRLAEALKRHPAQRGCLNGDRMQIYMMDLTDGGTTLIADEPRRGLIRSGNPKWSNDGRRIVFEAAINRQWERARLMSIELREGDTSPTLTDLGPGGCPTISSDDKKIAFLLTPGTDPSAHASLWVMDADGSNRRRAGEFGAPLFSRYGREFMINDFSDGFTKTIVMNLDKLTDGVLAVEGYQIFSWPSWAGPGKVVSSLATHQEADTIALLDVANPARAKIVEILWKRGPDLDLTPRWPLYIPESGTCYFFGVDSSNNRILLKITRERPGIVERVEPDFQDDWRGGLSASPDGRYLLFNANRPPQNR